MIITTQCIDFHQGANLMSLAGHLVDSQDPSQLDDSVENFHSYFSTPYNVQDMIGEGEAATVDSQGNWIGNLSEIKPERGYWVKMAGYSGSTECFDIALPYCSGGGGYDCSAECNDAYGSGGGCSQQELLQYVYDALWNFGNGMALDISTGISDNPDSNTDPDRIIYHTDSSKNHWVYADVDAENISYFSSLTKSTPGDSSAGGTNQTAVTIQESDGQGGFVSVDYVIYPYNVDYEYEPIDDTIEEWFVANAGSISESGSGTSITVDGSQYVIFHYNEDQSYEIPVDPIDTNEWLEEIYQEGQGGTLDSWLMSHYTTDETENHISDLKIQDTLLAWLEDQYANVDEESETYACTGTFTCSSFSNGIQKGQIYEYGYADAYDMGPGYDESGNEGWAGFPIYNETYDPLNPMKAHISWNNVFQGIDEGGQEGAAYDGGYVGPGCDEYSIWYPGACAPASADGYHYSEQQEGGQDLFIYSPMIMKGEFAEPYSFRTWLYGGYRFPHGQEAPSEMTGLGSALKHVHIGDPHNIGYREADCMAFCDGRVESYSASTTQYTRCLDWATPEVGTHHYGEPGYLYPSTIGKYSCGWDDYYSNETTCTEYDASGGKISYPSAETGYSCAEGWYDVGICAPGCDYELILEENSFLDDWIYDRGEGLTPEDQDHPANRLARTLARYGATGTGAGWEWVLDQYLTFELDGWLQSKYTESNNDFLYYLRGLINKGNICECLDGSPTPGMVTQGDCEAFECTTASTYGVWTATSPGYLDRDWALSYYEDVYPDSPESDNYTFLATIYGTSTSGEYNGFDDLDHWLLTQMVDGGDGVSNLDSVSDYVQQNVCTESWCLDDTPSWKSYDLIEAIQYPAIPITGGFLSGVGNPRSIIAYPFEDKFYDNLGQDGCTFAEILDASYFEDDGATQKSFSLNDGISSRVGIDSQNYSMTRGPAGWNVVEGDFDNLPRGIGFWIQVQGTGGTIKWTLPDGCLT